MPVEKKIVVMSIVVLMVGVIIGYAAAPKARVSPETEAYIKELEGKVKSLKSEVEELKRLVPPYRKGAWNLIATFKGSSEVETDYFYVAGTGLRLNWTWSSEKPEYVVFGIALYKEGETTATELFAFLQKEGTTHAHNLKAANYYLDISAANIDLWTITVEVWIPE